MSNSALRVFFFVDQSRQQGKKKEKVSRGQRCLSRPLPPVCLSLLFRFHSFSGFLFVARGNNNNGNKTRAAQTLSREQGNEKRARFGGRLRNLVEGQTHYTIGVGPHDKGHTALHVWVMGVGRKAKAREQRREDQLHFEHGETSSGA